jgi:hypothetical protein
MRGKGMAKVPRDGVPTQLPTGARKQSCNMHEQLVYKIIARMM